MNVEFAESGGETSGSDFTQSMHRGRIEAHAQLLHLLSDRCVGGEKLSFGQASFRLE